MGYLLQDLRIGLGGAYIHVAVDQCRVHANQLATELFGTGKRQLGFTGGGGPHHKQDGGCILAGTLWLLDNEV